MRSPVSITKAITVDEITSIRPLAREHIQYERSVVTVPTDWAETMTYLVADGRVVVLVAWVDSEAIGYASITTEVSTWTAETFAHLDCLYVAEAHRSAGIGRLLVDAAAKEARSQGHQEMQWQTPEWNSAAIRFYERLGATHHAKERFTLALPNIPLADSSENDGNVGGAAYRRN